MSFPTGCSTILAECALRGDRRRRAVDTFGCGRRLISIDLIQCGGNPARSSLPFAIAIDCRRFRQSGDGWQIALRARVLRR